jgi:hypothetical protein
MSLFRSVAIASAVSLLVGCSGSSSEEESPPDPLERFRNESVVVAPADSTNPSCAADPQTLDRATFAACLKMDLAKLPLDYEVTRDVLSFHPEKRNASILVMGAVEGAPAPWYAIIGVAAPPAGGPTSLVTPKNGGAVAAAPALVAGGVAVLEGVGIAVAAPEILAAAAATGVVLGTVYLIDHRQDIADGAQRVIAAVQTMFASTPKKPCTEGIPTGYTPKKEVDEYWSRCPQGTSTK